MRDNPLYNWTKVEKAFNAHFDDPNAMAMWLSQVRTLKMELHGGQRYTDRFLLLARKLQWDLADVSVIYQFKKGVTKSILKQLSVAESNYMLTTETHTDSNVKPIDVVIL